MNAARHPSEHLSPEALDDRILAVENRLMAREARLRGGLSVLGRRVDEATQPRRFIKPALFAAAGLAVLMLLRRRPHRRRHHAPPPATPQAAAAAVARPALIAVLAGLPWARLLGMAWPLLPPNLRERTTPAAVGSVLTIGLPVVESLLIRLRRHDGPARPR